MRRIAVYGTLRRNFGNYRALLEEQEFLGQETLDLPYRMVSLGGFPGLVVSDKLHPIVIEVFNIDDECARSVDGLEGYPTFYTRTEIPTSFGDAWVYYLANKDFKGLAPVEEGDWLKFITAKIPVQ